MTVRASRSTANHRAASAQRHPSWGVRAATALMFRRHRVALVAWCVPLLLMVAITVPAYQSTYPGLEQRAPLVAQMQNTDGMRLLYGILNDPGTLGQLFTWEVGSYVVILTCVMALLLGISTTRGEEDSGGLELVRTSGVHPVAPLVGAVILVFTACALVGGGSAAILLVQMTSTTELTVSGALGFGAVTTLAAFTVGLAAILCAQLRDEARGARALAFTGLGVAFLMRVVADQAIADSAWPQWLKTLNWWTPFGWKQVVSPYTEDRLWTLAVFAGVCVVLLAVVTALYRSREYLAAVLPNRSASRRRLSVATVEGWSWASGRPHVLGWFVAVLLVAALFGSMTAGLVQTLRDSQPTRDLIEQMSASGSVPQQQVSDPAYLLAQYYEFLGFYVALLVAVFAISAVLKWRVEEKSGHLDLELTAGTRRWRSLLARCTVAMFSSAFLLAAAAGVMGWLGELQMANDVGAGEPFRQSMTSTFGQLPAVMAGIGGAALLIALVPRAAGAIWAVIAVSAFLQTFGGLVNLPQWIRNLGLYAWAPAPGDSWPWAQMGLLAGVGVVGTLAAAALVSRRDITTG
ncbi:ABC transporter permease [Kocuria sp.]|uniref:ABC transporter permease n=1 Tax=Kocuria sp. TaxID=1871328 RepID=UPI0026DFAEEE|nr:hypothetical protein [Kocuria sp.]MDO5618156.1 hypothetical protein [Kocuria sp.]